jgi:hypothetical protein
LTAGGEFGGLEWTMDSLSVFSSDDIASKVPASSSKINVAENDFFKLEMMMEATSESSESLRRRWLHLEEI